MPLYTNLDGLVDFGRTKLRVEISSDGEHLETNLKGRVAIIGGVCPTPTCAKKVILVELTPNKDNRTTAKEKSVSGMFIRNANPWTGSRLSDGTINLASTSRLALEAKIDGEHNVTFVSTSNDFKGALYYDVQRMTNSGPRPNNQIEVSGNFANDDVKVYLTISIWATNCESVVKPKVRCLPNIESGLPGYVEFDSGFEILADFFKRATSALI